MLAEEQIREVPTKDLDVEWDLLHADALRLIREKRRIPSLMWRRAQIVFDELKRRRWEHWPK